MHLLQHLVDVDGVCLLPLLPSPLATPFAGLTAFLAPLVGVFGCIYGLFRFLCLLPFVINEYINMNFLYT
jgi:membrane associated rhomboid family serine protease